MIGPIPISAMWAYVDRYELPECTIDELLALDVQWLASVRGAPADNPAREALN